MSKGESMVKEKGEKKPMPCDKKGKDACGGGKAPKKGK
jgi:hypothetical protein